MKTERIEFVAPPGLKAKLHQEAAMASISVGELIRQKFEPSDDEKELKKLTAALKKATADAGHELTQAFNEVNSLVLELQNRRVKAEKKAA
jgi:hypothetical protein